MHWLLLIIHIPPSVWVDWGERPCKCQGPSLKAKPKQTLLDLRGLIEEVCPLGLGHLLSAFSVCLPEWLQACVTRVAPDPGRVLRRIRTVLCIPRTVSHIIKCPLTRVGSGHFYDKTPVIQGLQTAIFQHAMNTDHRGWVAIVNSS